MARFVFVSYPAWGHIDFGGRSFLRVARLLVDRGHTVTWVLPSGPDVLVQTMRFGQPHLQVRHVVVGLDVQAAITRSGIPVERVNACFDLMDPSQTRDRAIASVRTFAAFLTERQVDVCVIDRLAVVAGVAAHVAGVPWCVAGGTGSRWTTSASRGSVPGTFDAFPMREVCDAVGAPEFPESCLRSFWGISPFLNLSFFFRELCGEPPVEPTHFVGGHARTDEVRSTKPHSHSRVLRAPLAERSTKPHSHSGVLRAPLAERSTVLVTLGTTFSPETLPVVLPALVELCAAQPDVDVEILTGSPAITAQLAPHAAAAPRMAAKDWAPYDEAFGRAALAIGHGGNGFVWHSLAAGVPMIALPTSAGDQVFGSERIVALGVGRRLDAHAVTGAALVEAYRALAASEHTRARAAELGRALASGGGVDAAVGLVEELARTRRPVVACVEAPCCCAGVHTPSAVATPDSSFDTSG